MHNLKTPERLLHAEDDLNAVDVEGEVRWPSDDAIEALFGDLNHEELCDAWGVKPNAETMKDDKKEKETVAAAQLYSRVLEEVDAEVGEVSVPAEEMPLQSDDKFHVIRAREAYARTPSGSKHRKLVTYRGQALRIMSAPSR